MKKFWLHFGLAILIGAITAFGLGYVIPGWTRSDMISLFTLIVAIWQVGITRWEAIPAAELARMELNKRIQEEEDEKKCKIEATLSVKKLVIRNNGKIEVKNVVVKIEAPEHQEVMISLVEGYNRDLLKPDEKFTVGGLSFGLGRNRYVTIKIYWEEMSGIPGMWEKRLSP